MRKVLIGLAALGGIAALTYQFAVKPFRSWGLSPEEATATLPGDDVIPGAAGGETRAITIEASPASVWPWLVQMGSGRGGSRYVTAFLLTTVGCLRHWAIP